MRIWESESRPASRSLHHLKCKFCILWWAIYFLFLNIYIFDIQISQNYILQVYFHRIYISIYFLCQYLLCNKCPASARLLPFTWILPPPPPSSAVGSTQPCPRGENFQADLKPRATPCNVFSLPHMSVTDICINPDDQYLYQCSYSSFVSIVVPFVFVLFSTLSQM